MSWLRRLMGAKRDAGRGDTAGLAAEIRESFERAAADEEHFPSTIDERILHVKLVVEEMRAAAGGAILDVGAGKGRFAAVVQRRYPGTRVIALDLAHAMLAAAPAGLGRVCASMLQLPFGTESMGGVYAIESLEHAVDIDGALDEMCRVLKPGGPLVILDKNQEQWGRLQTPSWERWFEREDLEKRLRKRCRTVRSQEISYWEDVAPDGLFLAWTAIK